MKIFLEFSVNLLMALMGLAHSGRVFTQVTMTTRLFSQYPLNVFFVVNKSILAGKCFFLQPSGQFSRTISRFILLTKLSFHSYHLSHQIQEVLSMQIYKQLIFFLLQCISLYFF